MNAVCLFAFFAVSLVVLVNLVAALLVWKKKEVPEPEPENWPAVAILVAARNEEKNLSRCLEALEKLDYPAEKVSVWIGNDGSADKTLSVALSHCSRYAHWHVLDIREQWGQAKGKANVLAQLAHAAGSRADYFFITDADMSVPPSWLKGMLRFFRPGVAMVNGTSVVEERGCFGRMQRLDWLLAMGLAGAFASLPRIGEPVTAIGNNMVVEKRAYEETGGYEAIPFSITEDFELHRQLTRLGYKSLHVVLEEVKACTLPCPTWKELLHQRKRWMSGAMELPWPVVTILFINSLFFPAILVALFCSPFVGAGFFLLKELSQAFLIRRMLQCLGEPKAFPFLGYELYSMVLSISLIIFYFLPLPVRWKGRAYQKE